MPTPSIWSPTPYHVLAYGTLLGTQVFQSFIGGIVAYRALPRPQFASLQTAIFPIYFSIQSALPVVLALTYPGQPAAGIESSFKGILHRDNTWGALMPLGVMFATGVLNMVWVGPRTTSVMRERKHQETRDGRKSYDPPPHSKEMQKLNARFGRLHGASSLINMAGFIATVGYGWVLAGRVV